MDIDFLRTILKSSNDMMAAVCNLTQTDNNYIWLLKNWDQDVLSTIYIL